MAGCEGQRNDNKSEKAAGDNLVVLVRTAVTRSSAVWRTLRE